VYIGQTGRHFKARYKEKICILHKEDNSKYAKNFLDTQHEYSTTDDTLDLLKMTPKRTWGPGNSNMYNFSKEGLSIKEQYTNQNNVLLKLALNNR
jgi:hypothetical protein